MMSNLRISYPHEVVPSDIYPCKHGLGPEAGGSSCNNKSLLYFVLNPSSIWVLGVRKEVERTKRHGPVCTDMLNVLLTWVWFFSFSVCACPLLLPFV